MNEKKEINVKTVNYNIDKILNMVVSITDTSHRLEEQLHPVLECPTTPTDENQDINEQSSPKLGEKLEYITKELIKINLNLNDIISRLTVQPF